MAQKITPEAKVQIENILAMVKNSFTEPKTLRMALENLYGYGRLAEMDSHIESLQETLAHAKQKRKKD
jgi:hypothetical protein